MQAAADLNIPDLETIEINHRTASALYLPEQEAVGADRYKMPLVCDAYPLDDLMNHGTDS